MSTNSVGHQNGGVGYKESDKKPPMWLEIADKLGASVGEEMSLLVILVILVITRTNVKVHNNMPSLLK